MGGAHRLAVAELSKSKSKGKQYLKEVESEMTGKHVVNEGTESDNKSTSDKL